MPHRPVSALSAAVLAVVTAMVTAHAQSNASSPADIPQFRTGVALLRIDASVVDGSGRAVGDMARGDFDVHIDGSPRKVVFAQFTAVQGAPKEAGPVVPAYAVNTAQRGRAIAVVVDLASIRAGSEAPLLDTAAQLVDRLRPSDAVGLVPLPGQSIDLTRDHARVAGQLRGLRGTSEAPLFRHYFTLEEAVAYERRDKRVIDEVIERECARDVEAVRRERFLAGGVNPPPVCPTDLERETKERLWYERRHIEMVLTSLINLAQQLRAVTAPTTILLISGGLGFDQESLARFQQVEATLKQAGLAIYAVQVDQREVEASDSRPAKGSLYSSRDRESGLANVATMAGGAFFAGVGKAEGVFERLRTEITEAYELGVEALPGDLDGKPHEVKVATSRKATIRARRYVVSAAPPADWAIRLANLLAQPVDIGGLPIAAATYAVRGDDAATLKVLIRADVGRGAPTTAPVRYAVAIIGPRDTTVTNVTGTAAADGGVLLSTQLAPGRYRARIAAVDADGRAGSLEVPLVAGMRMAGGLQLSDLIPGASPDALLEPAIHVAAGDPFAPSLELSTDDSARFARTSVGFEVRRPGSAEVVTTGEGRLLETAYERQRIASAPVATDALAPGEYTLSAVVKVDGQPAARVSRTFILEPATRPAPPAAAAAVTRDRPATRPAAADRPAAKRTADPELDDLMLKAAGYVVAYGEQMSAVVAVEKYTQYVNPIDGRTTRPRQLLAEFALVKSGGLVPWIGYRDVMEVNGRPIHDRRDRLLKILTESANPLDEAARLTAESARFNVGPVSRNFNVPTAALFFFHDDNLPRFTFTRKGRKTIDGIDTSEIAFRETARPTIVTTRAGTDVPCAGTLWIAPDGTIVRTRLQLAGFADAIAMSDMKGPTILPAPPLQPPGGGTAPVPPPAQPAPSGGTPAGAGSTSSGTSSPGRGTTAGDPSSMASSRRSAFPELTMTTLESTASIEVTYRRDERLGMWLPARMTEEYQGAIPRLNNPPVLGTARSTAVYSDYRRFETGTKVVGPKK